MGRRTHTVEIEGYGPMTLRVPTRGQWAMVAAESESSLEQVSELTRRFLIKPNLLLMSDAEIESEFGHRPQVLAAAAGAIVDAMKEANK